MLISIYPAIFIGSIFASLFVRRYLCYIINFINSTGISKLSDYELLDYINYNNVLDILDKDDSDKNIPYYRLYIYIHPDVSDNVKDLYTQFSLKNNLNVDLYLDAVKNNTDIEKYCFNSGFDLICPQNTESIGAQKVTLDHKIQCCMKMNNRYVGYYLYSRSSTPVKTPLRLANSVGIIDSGYRGNIKAVFDNTQGYDFMEFILEEGNRYVQLCPPNLEFPMYVYIVDDVSQLGDKTNRGTGGFGSTGN